MTKETSRKESSYDKCIRDYEARNGEQRTSAMGEYAPCVDGE